MNEKLKKILMQIRKCFKNKFEEDGMLKSLLKQIVKTLPLNMVLSFLLSIFEDWAKKTETTIDDNIVRILKTILNEVDVTAGGLEYNPELKKYFKKLNLKSVLDWFIEKLEELAKKTETDVDDEIVAFFKDLITKYVK